MHFEPVYTVCINQLDSTPATLQSPEVKDVIEKEKKSRELLMQKETGCVSRLIQTV
jgi:hypothetical protein